MAAKSIALVATSFHKKHIDVMLTAARKTADQKKLKVVREIWVPGSLETPLALLKLLKSKDIDGAVVLGLIERGKTKHGLVMGMAVISAIIDIQLKLEKPIGVGILGPEILPGQIKPRLKPYAEDAVVAVWEMLNLK
ncbi:MAG: 6,7-dimethyl-8-ribityllumazine synthase [Candidatus Curtissbacteria bacterium GW2011_GWA1_40_16]|uniref:6,7-dimethyl-8-ribityllumazine synthase n=1 Tax=Candidatus Curtissbacteria bacterium GW2011_GWA1_40_16 TaxID=1618405 RepID=A0A0G0TW50_9BACT|nr:MAG: 6,7-dimethyl-8-ribityllumazine synthase [Candidatus Curtissbacteria bacterium GW2011_GWA1_40_16]